MHEVLTRSPVMDMPALAQSQELISNEAAHFAMWEDQFAVQSLDHTMDEMMRYQTAFETLSLDPIAHTDGSITQPEMTTEQLDALLAPNFAVESLTAYVDMLQAAEMPRLHAQQDELWDAFNRKNKRVGREEEEDDE